MQKIKAVLSVFIALFLIGVGTSVQGQDMEPQKVDTITNEELKKVAKTLQEAKTIQQEANQKLRKAVGETEMEFQRFQIIMRKKQMGLPADSINVTEDEQKTINELQPKLAEINSQSKKKFDKVVKDHGLTRQRLQQIMLVLRTKPEVAQRFQKIVAEQNQSG